MTRHILTTSILSVGAACLAMGAGSAVAGGGFAQTDWGMQISVVGPGSVTIPGVAGPFTNQINAQVSSLTRTVTVNPEAQGNGAVFAGWLGACEASGLGPCTVTMVDANGAECLWVGARFERGGEATPTLASPCDTPGGGGAGGGGAGGGGSAGGGASGGGASGGGAPLPPAGTTLQGGATVVRTAPRLAGGRASVRNGAVIATGRAPRGSTRVVQSLVFVAQQGVTLAGRCTLARAKGTFTCTAKPPKGRWRVITQAKRGNSVLAQSSAIVTVR